MATRSVQETSLTAIADAIRAKTGLTGKLVFPDGFEEAIEAITVGGGGLDGTITKAYSKIISGTFVPSEDGFTRIFDGVSATSLGIDATGSPIASVVFSDEVVEGKTGTLASIDVGRSDMVGMSYGAKLSVSGSSTSATKNTDNLNIMSGKIFLNLSNAIAGVEYRYILFSQEN